MNYRLSGMQSRNKGFTLVELVVVIVILGILSVTAAPKFVDLKSEARIATLKSMMGSIKATNNMVYAKAIFKGANTTYSEKELGIDWQEDCSANNCVEVDGVWVYFKYAYLDRNSISFVLDADIAGRKTKTLTDGKVVPNRCTGTGCLNKTCDSYNVEDVCTGYDFCQCRSVQKEEKCENLIITKVDGSQITKKVCTDSQFIIPRGTPYKNPKCYLRYTTAEILTGKVPIYKIESSGC